MSANRDQIRRWIVSAARWDGWENLFTGLGTDRDKRTLTTFAEVATIADSTLEAYFNDSDMAARIVETLPDEALRKGFGVTINDRENPEDATETEDAIAKALRELGTLEAFADAFVWARLFGGAGILVGADDGASEEQLVEPLAVERISKVSHLTVIDKRYLTPHKWYSDPSQPKYGKPETYKITNEITGGEDTAGVEVHESRFIIFDGSRVSNTKRQANQGWGYSALQRVDEVLQDFGVGWQAVGHLLTDGSQGVYKLKGLIDMIASENSTTVQQRMQVVDIGRSVCRSMVMDADTEEFERHSYNFGGVDKILQMFILRLAGAAKMPATKLMGQSPAGMNATGDADFQNWFAEVQAAQEIYLSPKLERLIELVTMSREGPTNGVVPDDWSVTWEEPWILTPLQKADLKLKTAQTDQININTGVVIPEEVTLSRFRPDGYSTETNVDLELRKAIVELESERALEKAENNTPETGQDTPGNVPASPASPQGDVATEADVDMGQLDGPADVGVRHVDSGTPEQNAAKDYVSNGLAAGRFTKPDSCSVCKQTPDSPHKIQAHHPDHSKPSQFRWLCTNCHKVAHDNRRKRGR